MRGVLLRKFSHLSRNLNCNNYITENAPFRNCFPSIIRFFSSENGSWIPESNPESEISVAQTEDKKTVTAGVEDVDNKDEVKRKGEKKFDEIGDRVEKGELEVEQGQKFEDQMVLERAKLMALEGSPQFDNDAVPNNKKEPDEPLGEGPILRWQTRVVFAPGGDAWHPKNRKVKLAVTVKEPGLSKHQFLRLRELAGKLYNPRKDQHTITSKRNISSICTAKFEPPIQEEDPVWVLCTRSTFLQIQQTLIQQCAKQRALKQGTNHNVSRN